MRHLQSYELLESSDKNVKSYSPEKFKKITGNDSAPGFTGWIYNIFMSLKNNFENMDNFFMSDVYMKDIHGKPIDTGMGWLIGQAGSLATSVAAKIFEPSEFISTNWKSSDGSMLQAPTSDKDVKTEHLRLFNDNFSKKDLPNIKSDEDMKSWITNFYKKAGTTPGNVKWVDDAALTAGNTYFNKSAGLGRTAAIGTEIAAGTEVAAGAEAGGLLATAARAAPLVVRKAVLKF
jgi:hypothetical protein